MNIDLGIAGKKYLVTGASSGIGQATAILISKLGGKVVLNGRNEKRLRETLSQMEGDGHYFIPFDLSNLQDISKFIQDCIKGDNIKFDGFVYAAGIINPTLIKLEDIDNATKMFKINYYPYIALLKEFSSPKVMNNGGAIVAISSSAAKFPDKAQAIYASTKAAVDLSSEVAAKEFVRRKIKVNTVRPHATATPMAANCFANPEISDRYKLGIIYPEDVAKSIAFLLSDFSSRITGQHIYISGGLF